MSTILIINSICTIQACENYKQSSDSKLKELQNKECDNYARNEYYYLTAWFKHSKCFFKTIGCPIEHNKYLGECEKCEEIAVRICTFSDKLEENIKALDLIHDEQKKRHLPINYCRYNSSSTFIKLYSQDKQLHTKSASELLEKEQELQNKCYGSLYSPNRHRLCAKKHDYSSYEHRQELEIFKHNALYRNKLKQRAINKELKNRLRKYPSHYQIGLSFMQTLAKHEYNNWKFE